MKDALDLYEQALIDVDGSDSWFRFTDGTSSPLEVARYRAAADRSDEGLLDDITGPVLDVGCGPGRHLHALAARGVYALGVDLSPVAVEFARRGGGQAIVADVFSEVPGAGEWATALLLDGNVGIGGEPLRLLARLATLLTPEGAVLVELDPPDTATVAALARIETGTSASSWFPWARVSAPEVGPLAEAAGFDVEAEWRCGERFFACLRAVPRR